MKKVPIVVPLYKSEKFYIINLFGELYCSHFFNVHG